MNRHQANIGEHPVRPKEVILLLTRGFEISQTLRSPKRDAPLEYSSGAFRLERL